MRSRWPSSSPVPATAARRSARPARSPAPTEPVTPVGARNSPNTPRSALAHSPVVTPARAHSNEASIRLASVCASATSRAERRLDGQRIALGTPLVEREDRGLLHRRVDALMAASRFSVSGLGSVVVYWFTPTMISSPDSIRRRRSACEGTSCALEVAGSTAATAPPISSMRAISSRAPRQISATLASITGEPSKMSSYSSRSVS